MSSGNIILINGTSSAGKSTIAKALQGMMESPFYLTGIDHFLRSFYQRLIVISSSEDATPPETWLAIFENEIFKRLEIGPRGYQLLAGMYHLIASLSESGIHSIVDDVIWDLRTFEIALNTLPAENVFFVGIQCPIEVAEQREIDRGDRALGGARFFGERVHRHGKYDLEVNSAASTAEESASQIKLAFENRPTPTVFQQLKAYMKRDK
jgi:chloramphenicol 3-O phosphotransferase